MNCYIHLPFCRSKCGYCAFYSEVGVAPATVRAYLDKLERDLAEADLKGRCGTIYLGGGTPTLLPLPELERLFAIIETRLAPAAGCEVSIEANPETLDGDKVALLREHVTRISLGVQSFDAKLRTRLGRSCSDEAIAKALELIRNADFPHRNIDLIYAIPGGDMETWRSDLRRAADAGIDHLSCYSLTPEEGSRLGPLLAVDDALAGDLYDAIPEVLAPYGIRRYEISNYARSGAECRHNVGVWRGEALAGFGPAAAGFDGTDRRSEVSDLGKWLAGAPPEVDRIPRDARLAEIFAVNLRTVAGWTPELWEQVPRADSWERRRAVAAKSAENMPPGWWKISPGCIKLSAEGLCFWNTVAEALLP